VLLPNNENPDLDLEKTDILSRQDLTEVASSNELLLQLKFRNFDDKELFQPENQIGEKFS